MSRLCNKVTSKLPSVVHVFDQSLLVGIRPKCKVSCNLCKSHGSPMWPLSGLGHSELETVMQVQYVVIQSQGESDLTKAKMQKNSFRKWRLWVINTFFLSLSSYVLQELVETERDYVRDLGYVVEVHVSGNLTAGVSPQSCLSKGYCIRQFNADTSSETLFKKSIWQRKGISKK